MGKNIYLTEEQFKDYIKFLCRKINKLGNIKTEKEIPWFYDCLSGDETGAEFDIFVPTIKIGEIPIVYTYNKNTKLYDGVYVLYSDKVNKKINEDIVRIFINNNLEQINNLCEGKIDSYRFRELMHGVNSEIITENFLHGSLMEMAGKLSKMQTGLDTDIWLDDAMLYKKGKHGPRIKFNAIQGNEDSHNFTSMTISDNPKVINLPKNSFLNNKQIEKIKKFVEINKNNLLLLGDKKIKLRSDFIPQMSFFNGDEIITPTSGRLDNNYIYLDKMLDGKYTLVKVVTEDNKFKYNIVDQNNIIIFNIWFDTITPFIQYGTNNISGYGKINKKWYTIYPNGEIRPV